MGQDGVDLFGTKLFFGLLFLDDALGAYPFDIGVAHVRQGRLSVRPQAFLHVAHHMLNNMFLFLRHRKHLFRGFVALYQFGGGKTGRTMASRRLILDNMSDGVNRLMDLAGTEIQVFRHLFLFGGLDQLIHQLADSFVLAGGDGDHRDAQKIAQLFYMDGVSAGAYLVHHVKGDDHGLAQLHQLRGRVGRGSIKSYCFAIFGDQLSKIGKERLQVFNDTTDGFEISRRDLELRGPGEFLGARQSGAALLRFADFETDGFLVEKAMAMADKWIREKDPRAEKHAARWYQSKEKYLEA